MSRGEYAISAPLRCEVVDKVLHPKEGKAGLQRGPYSVPAQWRCCSASDANGDMKLFFDCAGFLLSARPEDVSARDQEGVKAQREAFVLGSRLG